MIGGVLEMQYYFIDVLNFLQAISWPLVALLVFKFLAYPIKNIMESINEAIHERGFKVSSPTGVGVEVPGTQREVEDIKEFITKAMPQKYMKIKQSKTQALEPLQDTVAHSPQSADEVLEIHEASLVNDIYNGITAVLNENKDKEPEKEFLIGLLCDAYICLYFERAFQSIIASQLLLLKKLWNNIPDGVSEEEARVIFELHGEQKLKILFEKWLGFLEKTRFIKIEGHKIKLSNEGKEFMEYIVARGYTSNK